MRGDTDLRMNDWGSANPLVHQGGDCVPRPFFPHVPLPGISRLGPAFWGSPVSRTSLWMEHAIYLMKGDQTLSNARRRKGKKGKANLALLHGRLAVGIDVGQARHSAAGLNEKGELFARLRFFENTWAGIDKLEGEVLKRMGGPKAILIAMEATGHYWLALHDELRHRGYDVVVLNPIQTNSHSRAVIRKTKTDPLDAAGIAHLLRSGTAQRARIPDEETLELRMLCRRRWWLTDIITDLKRIMHSLMDRLFPELPGILDPFSTTTRTLIRELGLKPGTIANHADRVKALMTQSSRGRMRPSKMEKLIACGRCSIGPQRGQTIYDSQLRDGLDLLTSLEGQRDRLDQVLKQKMDDHQSPLFSLGFSVPVVATIHAESDPIKDFASAREYCAYCGIEPAVWQSGKRLKSEVHISKRGPSHLRRALYLAAMGHYRYNSELQRCYQRVKPGRHHSDAMIVVTHKLARIVWRLLTDNRPYKEHPPKRQKNKPVSSTPGNTTNAKKGKKQK